MEANPLDSLKDKVGGVPTSTLIMMGVGAVVALILLLILIAVLRMLFRKKPEERSTDANMSPVNLASLPAPPPPGKREVLVDGMPARLRLVVVAPIGRQNIIPEDGVGILLDQYVRGLGAIMKQDDPEVHIWPAQLSNAGFAPTFFRLVSRPEPDGKASRWILLAGATPARPKAVLLGLAFHAEEANTIGNTSVQVEKWATVLRIQ